MVPLEPFIDLHCHCLPGCDDGPATMSDSLALCRALVSDGVRYVVATPHQLGRYDHVNDGPTIRAGVEALNAELAVVGLPLTVFPGADVRIDERIFSGIGDGSILTVGDFKKALLLELPHSTYIEPLPFIQALREQGLRTVLTHPERHRHIQRNLRSLIPAWLAEGTLLQVTAGSLLGAFGSDAERAAWTLLDKFPGHVLVASDAHDLDRRRPCLSEAWASIAQLLGTHAARCAVIELPLLVVGTPKPSPVPAVRGALSINAPRRSQPRGND